VQLLSPDAAAIAKAGQTLSPTRTTISLLHISITLLDRFTKSNAFLTVTKRSRFFVACRQGLQSRLSLTAPITLGRVRPNMSHQRNRCIGQIAFLHPEAHHTATNTSWRRRPHQKNPELPSRAVFLQPSGATATSIHSHGKLSSQHQSTRSFR
jgi:hypothetical protein